MSSKRSSGLDHLVKANGRLEELRYFPDPVPVAPDPRIDRILGKHSLAKRFFDNPRALGIDKNQLCNYCNRPSINGHCGYCKPMEIKGSPKSNTTKLSSSSNSSQLCMICSITNAMCNCFQKPANPTNGFTSSVSERNVYQMNHFDRYAEFELSSALNQYQFNYLNSNLCSTCVQCNEKCQLHRNRNIMQSPLYENYCSSCTGLKEYCSCPKLTLEQERRADQIRQVINNLQIGNSLDPLPDQDDYLGEQIENFEKLTALEDFH